MSPPLMLVEIYAAEWTGTELPERAADICDRVTKAGLVVFDAFTMPDDGAIFILVPGTEQGPIEQVFQSVGIDVDRVTATERATRPGPHRGEE